MPTLPKKDHPIIITESRKVHRITMKRWFSSLLEAFEIDRGGLYTLKRLFVNPGKLFLDYLGAQRFHFIPPFRLLIVSTAIIIITFSLLGQFDAFFEGFNDQVRDQPKIDSDKLTFLQDIFLTYFNLFLWIYLPAAALMTWAFNTKKRFNFPEHLVLHTYLLTLSNLLSIVLLIGTYLQSEVLLIIYILVMFFYYVQTYHFVFEKGWLRSIIEMSIILIISFSLYFILLVLIFAGILFI